MPAASHHVYYASTESPIGTLWIAMGAAGVCTLDSTCRDEFTFVTDLEQSGHPDPTPATGQLDAVIEQLAQYFAGSRRQFEVAIDLHATTAFARTVLRAVAAVGYGEARSYGDIAWEIGHPRAARAVGTALATNPVGILIPCHRIIRSDGTIGEYARRSAGPEGRRLKRELLALEGWTPQ